MAHFAKIENGLVTSVIVAEQDFIDSGTLGDPSNWIQTSYNTRGGIHYGPNGLPDDLPALRKNYAGIGSTYDVIRDAFIPPKLFASWILDENTCHWNAPVPMPQDGKQYIWDESSISWIEFK